MVFDLNKYKNRRYFDEKRISPDVWSVLRTASLLSVGEFRVFELSYENWFGVKGDEKTIENYFIPYMFNDVVPLWVRHFCQNILRLDEEGSLDPKEFGIQSKPATREQQYNGLEYFLWIVLAMLLLVVIADAAGKLMKLQCMFPPCY